MSECHEQFYVMLCSKPHLFARKKLYTSGEVILCGGAINTPQLLMLSGVGPADVLKVRVAAIEK